MCCEDCINYQKCEEQEELKDNCCPKCAQYNNCVGSDEAPEDSSKDKYFETGDEEDPL